MVPGLFAAGAVAVLIGYAFASVPLPEDLDLAPTVVYDVAGREIGELQQQATRTDVALADLPEHVVEAVLAAEDAGFYEHHGVSVVGILRAAYANLTRGEIDQGGSTISQQYVKNLTGETDETLLRKINEAALAVKLERQYSKAEILRLYLNSIYFGRGAYGIQAGAQAYFGVDATDLSPEQAAQLAGLLPAPSSLDPAENPEGAERRYRYVVDRLLDEGWITPRQAGAMRAAPPEVVRARTIVARQAPFFLAMVERELAGIVGDEHVHRGLEVHTTLDLEAQRAAERAYDDAFGALEVPEGATAPTGALVALDPATGGVRALVGGPDYASDQVNLATGGVERAGRGPGSTFKPFALAAWVERGWSPESQVSSPAELVLDAEELGIGEDWELANYGQAEHGTITVREATTRSSNTAYAQLAVEVGPERVLDIARRAGVDAAERLRPDPSLVLGTGEVTPIELAEGYATFASGGTHRPAITVLAVSRGGDPLYDANVEGRPAFSEQVAYTVTDVLTGVIAHGTGTAAQIGRPAAGKTGTSQNYGDAWFAGYTPDLAAVVWMGNRDDRSPIVGEPTGGGFPAVLWREFMREALEGVEPAGFPSPAGELAVHDLDDAPPTCEVGERLAPVDPDDADSELACVEAEPTAEPTPESTEEPTPEPTEGPTPEPTEDPTRAPPVEPTLEPPPATDPEPTPTPTEPTAPPEPAESTGEGGGAEGADADEAGPAD